MKDIQDALARVGKSLAEIAQVVVNAMDNLTPEQRAVIEFLAKNPEIAEAFQELNQKLARQRAIRGAIKEATQPKEPLIKDEKIRKAVRAWAEALCLSEAYCASNGYEIYGGADDHIIQFPGEPFPFADNNKIYTIAELCGEEEE